MNFVKIGMLKVILYLEV